MKNAEIIKKKLCKEIDEIGERGALRPNDVEMLYKMTAIVKRIGNIEEQEQGGEEQSSYRRGSYRGSYADGSMRGGSYDSYDGGDSYRRGRSYAEDDGTSYRRGRNQYSRGDAKDHMMHKLGEMMHEADKDTKKILEMAMREIEEL